MTHDVFICYDEADKQSAEEVCHVFEENKIKCWIKSRDYSYNDSVEKITNAIRESKSLVVIYSKNSKNSKPVITEVDIAFGSDVKIIVFNIDESKNNGGLEFFIKNKPWISAFPKPSEQLKELVNTTSQIDTPAIPSKSVKYFKKIKPVGGAKLKKFLKIGIPIAIVLILIFSFIIYPMGRHTTDEGDFTMKITNVDVKEANGRYFYTVLGESYNLPQDSHQYVMRINFFDELNNNVYSVNATADEFSSGVICHIDLAKDNITNVTFKLVDLKENVLSEDYFELT